MNYVCEHDEGNFKRYGRAYMSAFYLYRHEITIRREYECMLHGFCIYPMSVYVESQQIKCSELDV